MDKQTTITILAELVIIYWWLCLTYARRKAAAEKAVEDAKYAAWDTVYKKSLWEGKGHYQSTVDAALATRSPQNALVVWNDIYNRAINNGVRKFKAGEQASAAARLAAHKHK